MGARFLGSRLWTGHAQLLRERLRLVSLAVFADVSRGEAPYQPPVGRTRRRVNYAYISLMTRGRLGAHATTE